MQILVQHFQCWCYSYPTSTCLTANTLTSARATSVLTHLINLFFVDKSSQAKGIGKKLINIVIDDNENSFITVNSSRYAVPIYEKIGFVKTEEEKEQDGLKFTPMKLILKQRVKYQILALKQGILHFYLLHCFQVL